VNQFSRQSPKDDEASYKMLAENVQDVIWVLDSKKLTLIYASPSIEEYLGYGPTEVVGRPISELLLPGSYVETLNQFKILSENFEQGLPHGHAMELELYCQDGATVWGEMVCRFIKSEEGRLLILCETRDITKRKTLEQERDRLIAELGTALEEQKRLARENKVLRGLLPICAECKKIRDDKGVWHDLETFIEENSQAEFTHTLCPDCMKTLWPEIKTKGK
jgi:PAS domain S-box-containing protein